MGRKPTPSSNLFAKWMERMNLSPVEVAQRIRVSVASIHQARAGNRIPTLPLAVALERLSDGEVPVESWLPDYNPKPLDQRKRKPRDPEAPEEPGDRLAAS